MPWLLVFILANLVFLGSENEDNMFLDEPGRFQVPEVRERALRRAQSRKIYQNRTFADMPRLLVLTEGKLAISHFKHALYLFFSRFYVVLLEFLTYKDPA
jgi:hypothetical protein